MENNFLLTDDLLWDYADGFLDPETKVLVENYLHQHPDWQLRLDAIHTEKKAFTGLSLERPNPGFADRVMAAWAIEQVQAKAAQPGKDWIIRLIVAVFSLFVLIPLVAMIFAAVQVTPEAVIPFEIPTIPTVNWTGLFSIAPIQYLIYLGLTFLSLRLLEKYLQHKGILNIR